MDWFQSKFSTLAKNINLSSSFVKRTISTVILFLFVGCILFFGKKAIQLFIVALAIGLSFEWVGLTSITRRRFAFTMSGIITLSMLPLFYNRLGLAFGMLFLVGGLSTLFSWYHWQRHFLWVALGTLYVGVASLCAMWASVQVEPTSQFFAWLIITISMNDIGAYLVGSRIKGPKLIPEISPNKTWSGFAGGILIGTIFSVLSYKLLGFKGSNFAIILTSVILTLVATLGDIFESAIKRYHGRKDSGGLIPAHGGLFDRMDGFLFVFPVVAWMTISNPQLFDIKTKQNLVEISKEATAEQETNHHNDAS